MNNLTKTCTLKLAACLLFMIVCCACGKKADPGLPLTRAPKPVQRLHAFARSESIVLIWRAPRENTDETPLIDLAGFTIYRDEVPLEDVCARCPKNFMPIYDYDYRGPRGSVPEKQWMIYHDRERTAGNLYTYMLRSYNEQGVAGPRSALVHVYWDVPPAPPRGLAAARRYRVVDITWQPPDGLEDGSPAADWAGYNVYRSTEPGTREQLPLNEGLVTGTSYQDVPEERDTVYFYTVRAVRAVHDTLIESAPAAEVQMAYRDITPPGTPQALTAVPTENGMLLKWMPKTESDFAGFNLYRRGPGEPSFRRLNEELITQSSWLDTTALIRKRYVYAVTSVDTSAQANESDFSEPVEVLYITR